MSGLVLTRKVQERFMLYTDDGLMITIRFCGIDGGQARFHIAAPVNVHIDREEVYDRKQIEKIKP
jgi:carbon storage regulator CsrA